MSRPAFPGNDPPSPELHGITRVRIAESDARPVGDGYVVNGAKTFISGGVHCDLVIAAVKTDRAAGRGGISLLVIESKAPGFTRGRKLEKIGLHGQDTAELFFDDLEVVAANLLGEEGTGFSAMMHNLAQERMSIAVMAVAAARAALEWTLEYVKQRRAFGQLIGTFQNSRLSSPRRRRKSTSRKRSWIAAARRSATGHSRARTPRRQSGGAPKCRAA